MHGGLQLKHRSPTVKTAGSPRAIRLALFLAFLAVTLAPFVTQLERAPRPGLQAAVRRRDCTRSYLACRRIQNSALG